MPFPRRPHRASPDEIKITRDGDDAAITYADPVAATTHLRMGREKLATMTDEQILAEWNEGIDAREELMKEYDHIAVEVPIGKPQVAYMEKADQWVPRGHVLRCVVEGFSEGDPDQPFVTIDEKDFTLTEFAKMVGTFGGWGMRITFVPDDEVHDEPVVEVREPDPQP
jgi:hypothetical protein